MTAVESKRLNAETESAGAPTKYLVKSMYMYANMLLEALINFFTILISSGEFPYFTFTICH